MKIAIICLIIFLLSSFLFLSCEKEELIKVDHVTIDLNTNGDLRKILFLPDSIGLICGGNKNELGLIYRTINNGLSWQIVYSDNKHCLYDLFFLDSLNGFACGDSLTLLKTTDGGETWSEYLFNNFPYDQFMVPIRSMYFFNQDTAFFAGGEFMHKGLISSTFNAGYIWSHLSIGNEWRCILFTDRLHGFASGYGQIYKTIDGGQNFTPCDITGDYYNSLYFFSTDIGFAAGYNGGIYRTTNAGNNWSEVINDNGMFDERIHLNYIHFFNQQLGYVVGNSGVIMKSTNGGNNWKRFEDISNKHLYSFDLSINNYLFITAEKGKIFLIKDK